MAPLWDSPPRTLKTALERLRTEPRGVGGTREIKYVAIQAVVGDRTYVVDGVTIPTTGFDSTLRAGQIVPVLYQDSVPIVIFGHLIRRAQFGDLPPIVSGGVIEQLFVVQDSNAANAWDVFFRNHSVCKPLGARKLLTGNESLNGAAIKWGPDGRYFVTRATGGPYNRPVYTVWKLNRTANKILSAGQVPSVTKVATYDWSTDTVPIVSVTPQWQDAGASPYHGAIVLPSPFSATVTQSLSSPGVAYYYPGIPSINAYLYPYVQSTQLQDPWFCLDDHDPPHLVVGLQLTLTINGQWYSGTVQEWIRTPVPWRWGWVYDVTAHAALLTDYPTGGDASRLLGTGPYLHPSLVPNWWNMPNVDPTRAYNAIAGLFGGAIFAPVVQTRQGVTAFVAVHDKSVDLSLPGSGVLRFGALWLRDGALAIALRALGAAAFSEWSRLDTDTVWLTVTGDRHHVLWSFPVDTADPAPAPYRLSSLDLGLTQALGSTTNDFYTVDAQNLIPLATDYLWKAVPTKLAPAKSKQYYFISGWKWPKGAPTLVLTTGDYPEDLALQGAKILAAFPTNVSDLPRFGGIATYRQANAFQVVNDSTVLSPLGRYLTS